MDKRMRAVTVLVLAVVVGAVLMLKAKKTDPGSPEMPASQAQAGAAGRASAQALPRLVDLGAGTCVPCQMMEPVLEALREQYAGRLEVVFHDVRREPKHLEQYNVRVIPTQVFYGADGRELWRHEGFLGLEEIVAKWRELGVDLGAAADTTGDARTARQVANGSR